MQLQYFVASHWSRELCFCLPSLFKIFNSPNWLLLLFTESLATNVTKLFVDVLYRLSAQHHFKLVIMMYLYDYIHTYLFISAGGYLFVMVTVSLVQVLMIRGLFTVSGAHDMKVPT